MATITVTFTREIDEDEVESMITGTGALGYPWWTNYEKRDDGMYRITHWDGGDDPSVVKYTDVSDEMIASAFSELVKLEYIDPTQSDNDDAIRESLGYLDAEGADMVLQQAIFSEIVYG